MQWNIEHEQHEQHEQRQHAHEAASEAEHKGQATPIVINHALGARDTAKGCVGAAYMNLVNTGDEADAIIGATTHMAKRVELHTHILGDNDTVKMVEIT